MTCVCFAKVSDVYIRRDNFGVITTTRLITDNFVYFLTNGNATVTVNIDFECGTFFSYNAIKVGLPPIVLYLLLLLLLLFTLRILINVSYITMLFFVLLLIRLH